MLKYTILFTTVFCMVQSQRPWHAGTGGRLPQVLPQYIDEQAAQATPTAQGDEIIPSQGTQTTPGGQEAQGVSASQRPQGVPVGQGAQEIPVRQGAGIPAYGFQPMGTATNQGTQGTPTYQGAQGVLMCPCVQGTPTYQGAQGIPMYQGAQGIPMYQGAQGTPTYQGTQGIPMYQGAQGTPIINTGNTMLGNRIDGGDSAVATAAPLGTTINPADLPVDAHGDIDLINRIKTWPRDKQPFWYINWQAIQAHRGDVNNTAQPAQTEPNTRSFFAG